MAGTITMFDKLKDLGQLAQLASKAQKVQEAMKTMQEQLGSERITGDAGAGRVTATVNGRMELIEVRIDRDRVDTNNIDMLQDLVTAAVRTAQYRAAEVVRQKMQQVAADAGLPPEMLPGAQ